MSKPPKKHRYQIDISLLKVKTTLIDALQLVRSQYEKMVIMLKTKDYDLYQEVKANNRLLAKTKINFVELSIWQIAKQGLKAYDLRTVAASMFLISDMHRIGEYAYNISRYLNHYQPSRNVTSHVVAMVERVMVMLDDCEKVFVQNDLQLAFTLLKYDRLLKTAFRQENAKILKELKESNDKIYCSLLMRAAQQIKYIERAGDHIMSIAEWLFYIQSGEMIPIDKLFDDQKNEMG